ncbi:MAG: hypothetical protein SCL54_06755 [Bacillota bacterium]|nr:hypothetical protein [Bacillota bacterium]
MKYLSWFNVILLIYLLSFPLALELNKRVFRGKKKKFNKALKMGRKFHPYVGITLVVTGLIHGYNKLGGTLSFHTGSLLLLILIINGFIGFMYKKKRNKKLATTHRIVGIAVAAAFLLHYINPWFFQ